MKSNTSTILIIGLVTLVAGAIIIFIALPLWQSVNAAYADRDAAAQIASNLEQQRENLKKFADQKQDNETISQKLENLIPTETNTDSLIVSLEQLANIHNLRLTLLSIETSTKKKDSAPTIFSSPPSGVDTIQLSIEVAGNYNQIKDFVYELSNYERLIEVGTINLSDDSQLGVSAELAVRAFYKQKTTVKESSASFSISDSLRDALLNQTSITPPTPTGGRPDPFAAVE